MIQFPSFRKMSLFIVIAFILASCSNPTEVTTTEASNLHTLEVREIILATTTSTQDSGLLDDLVPIFEEQSGYIVQTVAVGTGQALEMGEQGNADVLLVHAPAAEKELMEAGFGSERFLVMHNDFVIVGPEVDPATITGSKSSAEAFQKIAQTQSTFISRGDDSGTHKKELEIWNTAGIEPEGDWYQESGQAMGATLTITSEKEGYTLTDRATYLSNQDSLDLMILGEGDPGLLNVYHVIVVNPEKWPEVNIQGAQAFSSFMTSPETQGLIESFGVEEFGQSLFFPDADKTDAELGLE